MKIAIDGPAGAGKSTVARKLAQELGFVYIDTGAMYRALTWKALQKKIDPENTEALYELANSIRIHFEYHSGRQKVICDGEDLTATIRLPEVSAMVSTVASHPAIRKIMVEQQQEMARSISVVMDGRDIGECVLPDAEYKFYLTASIEERTHRRTAELSGSGFTINYETIFQDITQRDKRDSEREIGSLKILAESIVIDSSNLSIEQVLQKMLAIIRGE
ncbi:MAG: (d)CMP kinase [Syntrophomonadaceae bacterium]|nr:(d)CMP kinase [Syntrophomonadaceae bacterium]MDD3899550.1 (d)CMP kinase [Syntrophomonadaceae bacterium]